MTAKGGTEMLHGPCLHVSGFCAADAVSVVVQQIKLLIDELGHFMHLVGSVKHVSMYLRIALHVPYVAHHASH